MSIRMLRAMQWMPSIAPPNPSERKLPESFCQYHHDIATETFGFYCANASVHFRDPVGRGRKLCSFLLILSLHQHHYHLKSPVPSPRGGQDNVQSIPCPSFPLCWTMTNSYQHDAIAYAIIRYAKIRCAVIRDAIGDAIGDQLPISRSSMFRLSFTLVVLSSVSSSSMPSTQRQRSIWNYLS